MATIVWTGGAVSSKYSATATAAGTFDTDGFIGLTIGNKTIKYLALNDSTTASVMIEGLKDKFIELTTSVQIPGEFSEITVTADGSDLPIAGTTNGKEIKITLEVDDGGGTGTFVWDSGSPIQATGPRFIDNAENWRDESDGTSGVPTSSDDVVLRENDVDILYGFDSNLECSSFTKHSSYTGRIGLPAKNSDNTTAYDEYRTRFLPLQCSGNIKLGVGAGRNSERNNIHLATKPTDVIVYTTGQSVGELHPIEFTSADSLDLQFSVLDGRVGFATSNDTSIQIEELDNSQSGLVYLGNVTWGTTPAVHNTGTIFSDVAMKALTNKGGSVTIYEGAAAIGSANYIVNAGEVLTHESGTLSKFSVFPGATFSRLGAADALTITDSTIYPGGNYIRRKSPHSNPVKIPGGGVSNIQIDEVNDSSGNIQFTPFATSSL